MASVALDAAFLWQSGKPNFSLLGELGRLESSVKGGGVMCFTPANTKV